MTTAEITSQLNSLIDDNGQGDNTYLNDIAALTAAIEAISTSNGEKLYTAFEIIRLVQAAVSDEVCAMDVSDAAIGYEIERSIIGKLAKEDEYEN